MVVKVQEADGVKVYNITADKTLPAWVKKRKNAQLSRDAGYAKHVDLIQVLPSSCELQEPQTAPFQHTARKAHMRTGRHITAHTERSSC
jgi:hypothetical protein